MRDSLAAMTTTATATMHRRLRREQPRPLASDSQYLALQPLGERLATAWRRQSSDREPVVRIVSPPSKHWSSQICCPAICCLPPLSLSVFSLHYRHSSRHESRHHHLRACVSGNKSSGRRRSAARASDMRNLTQCSLAKWRWRTSSSKALALGAQIKSKEVYISDQTDKPAPLTDWIKGQRLR